MAETNKSKITVLQLHQAKDVFETVSWLYDQAMRGEVSGIAFMVKYSRYRHMLSLTGQYKDDPVCALRPAQKLCELIERRINELEHCQEIV